MEFSVEHYKSATGADPVGDFLKELYVSDLSVHKLVIRKLVQLRDSRNHGRPLTADVGDGILELRHDGELNTRILWFYREGRRIILLHGIRHKGRKIPPKALEVAKSRRADWIRRHGR